MQEYFDVLTQTYVNVKTGILTTVETRYEKQVLERIKQMKHEEFLRKFGMFDYFMLR